MAKITCSVVAQQCAGLWLELLQLAVQPQPISGLDAVVTIQSVPPQTFVALFRITSPVDLMGTGCRASFRSAAGVDSRGTSLAVAAFGDAVTSDHFW